MSSNTSYRPSGEWTPHNDPPNWERGPLLFPGGASSTGSLSTWPPQSLEIESRIDQGSFHDQFQTAWRAPSRVVPRHQYHGSPYNTTNHNHASATTIQHASNIFMPSQTGSDDWIMLETLPRHPDISGKWMDLLRNSRDVELREIWNWIDTPMADMILWVHGDPGLGKSALAYKLKNDLRSRNRLAASVFLSHLSPDLWGPETIIRLIGGEIGRMHNRAVPTIAAAVRQCHGASLEFHVEKLVRDPIIALQLHYPLIVIIDGFAESGTHYKLVQQLSHLTPYSSLIRFVVLGRSEPRQNRFKNTTIRSYSLGPVSADIMAEYLDTCFDTIEWEQGGRPTSEDVLRLADLSNGLFTRVEDVTSIFRGLPSSNDEEFSEQIFDLSVSSYHRFESSKSAEELTLSIILDRVALALRPPNHPQRHSSLSSLALSLQRQHEISRSLEDIEEAISFGKECLMLRPLGHEGRIDTLNDLGNAIHDRFLKSRSTEDRDEGIQFHREALVLCSPCHEDRHHSCYNLALELHERYEEGGSVGDLDEAISLGREAVLLRPQGHELRFRAVENLRMCIEDRFKIKGAVEDLQEAIRLAEEAVSTRPADAHTYAILPGKLSYYRAELARVQASSVHVGSESD